jgi:hypothetical protein
MQTDGTSSNAELNAPNGSDLDDRGTVLGFTNYKSGPDYHDTASQNEINKLDSRENNPDRSGEGLTCRACGATKQGTRRV